MKLFHVIIVLFANFFTDAKAVRITRFVVPSTVTYGSTVELDCAYDLQGENLYVVQWYKDQEEFSRCKNDGSVLYFRVRGVNAVRNLHSTLGSCPVTLERVAFDTAGSYMCQVSTEAPTFKLASREETIKVKEPVKYVENDTTTSSNNIKENSNNFSGSMNYQSPVLLLFTAQFLLYVHLL